MAHQTSSHSTHLGAPSSTDYYQQWRILFSPDDNQSQNDWAQFYRKWWGPSSPGKNILAIRKTSETADPVTPIIQIQGEWVLSAFSAVELSLGTIIVRKEFVTTYSRLCDLYLTGIRGVVLTGQPGIGKSYFAVYALLRRMAEGKPVMYASSEGQLILIDETGIKHLPKDHFSLMDLPSRNKGTTSRVWSIVDASEDRAPETSLVLSAWFFPLFVCPPVEIKYKGWMKQSGAMKWVMNPWSKDELELFMSQPVFFLSSEMQAKDDYPVEDLLERVGPCPRDIKTFVLDPAYYDMRIEDTVNRLDVDTMITFFRQFHNSTRRSGSEDDSVSQLVLIWRTKRSYDVLHDRYHLTFKTPIIRLKVREHFARLHLEQARRLFDAAKSFPETSTLAGIAFETLANGYISGIYLEELNAASRTFCEIARMSPVQPPHSDYSWSFRHSNAVRAPYVLSISSHRPDTLTPSASTSVLQVTGDGHFYEASVTQDDLPLSEPHAASAPPSWTKVRRGITFYDDVKLLTLDTGCLFCPIKRNNPLFDSFCLEMTDEGQLILWVFQMTIAKEHGGGPSGFPIISDIVEKMTEMAGSIVVKFVLVTPYKENHIVRWDFSEEFKTWCQDEVWVQYMDVSLYNYASLINPPSA